MRIFSAISKILILSTLLFLAPSVKAYASFTEDVMGSFLAEGITVDVKDPVYEDGVVKTEKGGVVQGPGIRIQALKISYTRKTIDGVPTVTVIAEDNVMLEYGEYVFIGKRLEYDFQNKYGSIYQAKSAMFPWYFGGEWIELLCDGTYIIHEGYITTSESTEPDWQLLTTEAVLVDEQFLEARNVQFRFGSVPVFWLPSFKTDLKAIFDSPIRYRLRWGGEQGLRFGLIYELLDWNDIKMFLRLDYRFDRGPAGGFETAYCSRARKEEWHTINYIARDNSIEEPKERMRYRFEGIYKKQWDNDRTSLNLVYDKISDKEMPTDYSDKDLDLGTGQRTQLIIRRQEQQNWITNFCTRIQLNNFETVKQELPNIYTTYHPIRWEDSGVISDSRFSIGYLDFKSNHDLPHPRDYSSARCESYNRLYRPFYLGPFVNTPEVGAVAIFYSNSKQETSKLLASGLFGYELNTQLTRFYGASIKHSIVPYAHYQYFTAPTVSLKEHYIFDIQDGWHRFHRILFGTRNLIYAKAASGITKRCLFIDLFTNVFFNTPTIPSPIPKIYSRIIWDATDSLRYCISAGWDTIRNDIEHINFRTEWTINEDLAFTTEYRHRNPYSWRKADPLSFILESSRPENLLRHSALSDKRDTLLGHLFWRFYPNWAIHFQTHYGWNRRKEPGYFEYQTDLTTILPGGWNFKVSYQHREDDHRLALYLNLGLGRPVKEYITEEG